MNVQDETVITTIELILKNYIKFGGNVKVTGRIIGTLLFEHSTTYSGKTSENALINKYLHGQTWCNEHLWPRQHTGEKLIRLVSKLGRVNKTILTNKIIECTVVNRVTKIENEQLKLFQKADTFISPKYSYKQVGIKLLDWRNGDWIRSLPKKYPHLIPFLEEPIENIGKI